jgi:hypothetical protein
MPEGLYLGRDFVLTSLYEAGDFPVNSFVVKVNKSRLGSPNHQKLKVEQNLDGATCVTYNGTEYLLFENDLPYSPHGQSTGNYTTKRYSSYDREVKHYYGIRLFATWADLTARFPGIKLIDKQNNQVTSIQDSTFMCFTTNPKLDQLAMDVDGFDPVLHKINIEAVTTVNTAAGRLYAPFPGGDDDKLFLDDELVMPVPAIVANTYGSSIDYMQIAGQICSPIANTKKTSPFSMLVSSPKLGSWIDKVTGRRVDYIGTSSTTAPGANIWSVINDKVLPQDHKSPADLQLVKIELPIKPTNNILFKIWSIFTGIFDLKTVLVILACMGLYWLWNQFGAGILGGLVGSNGS